MAGRLLGHVVLQAFLDDPDVIDSHETKLSDVVPPDGRRFRFRYEYDFGDDWLHSVLVENPATLYDFA